MKTKEFIKKVEELGFAVNTVENYYVILNKILVCAEICRTSNRVNLFHECLEKNDLLKICVEYAQTPLTEREKEKRYYLRKFNKKFYEGEYLNHNINYKHWGLGDNVENAQYKTKFTWKEIEDIKKRFDTELCEFVKEVVE